MWYTYSYNNLQKCDIVVWRARNNDVDIIIMDLFKCFMIFWNFIPNLIKKDSISGSLKWEFFQMRTNLFSVNRKAVDILWKMLECMLLKNVNE